MWENFKNGLVKENPVFALYLGLCSILAVSTSLTNAVGMSVSVIFVLILANVIISLLRHIIPNEIRIPVYIVIIATLVTIVQMLMDAYAPELSESLGAFIGLIVVNCIILGRVESYASKNSVGKSFIDGVGMGIGYTLALVVLSAIRQLLGTGVLNFYNPLNNQLVFELNIIPADYVISLFTTSAGAFITFGVLAAGVAYLNNRNSAKKGGNK